MDSHPLNTANDTRYDLPDSYRLYAIVASTGESKIYLNGLAAPVLVDPDPTVAIGGGFSNWDTSYFLGLANEFTNDRPWLGDYHLLAIYNRALTEEDVITNFQTGPY